MSLHRVVITFLAVDLAAVFWLIKRIRDCKVDESERSHLGRLCFECRTIYSPFGAIIGSLSSELQSLKAELMLN